MSTSSIKDASSIDNSIELESEELVGFAGVAYKSLLQ
jgi:hypothetical protein